MRNFRDTLWATMRSLSIPARSAGQHAGPTMHYANTSRSLFLATAALLISSGFAVAQEAPNTLVSCSGGAQEFVSVRTQNAQFSTTSANFVQIPDMLIAGGASGAGADSDLYVVTFAGEADSTGGIWEVQAQVSVNGGAFTNMNPSGPNSFQQGRKSTSPAMTWCQRIVATSTNFRMVWRKVGGNTALIDDYTMTVTRSN